MNLSDLLETGSSQWLKYDEYMLKKADSGEIYILPKPVGRLSAFSPSEFAADLIADALNTGKSACLNDENTAQIMLEFAGRYGLLGIMTNLSLSNFFLNKKHVLLGVNPLTKSDSMRTQKYVEMFLPFGTELIIDYKTGSVSGSSRTEPLPIKKSPEYAVMFSGGYCEKLDWHIGYFKNLYRHFEACIKSQTADAAGKFALSGKIDNFYSYGAIPRVKMNDTPTLFLEFNSLKAAIDTFYCFLITDSNAPLHVCKHCEKIFFTKDTRAEFCSHRCRNQFHVYKSRAKSKE